MNDKLEKVEPTTFTVVRIETSNGEDRFMTHVQSSQCELTIWALGDLIKQCLLGMGYHPDNVRDLFNEEEDKSDAV